MSFVFSLRACEFDSVWSSLSSCSEEDCSLSLSLPLPLLVADRRSGHIGMLVRFRLGVLVFILISVLCSIPDRLSSDCFWAHP